MLSRIYLAFGALLVVTYGLAGFDGWEYSAAKREVLAPDVRNSPGGYRSFHFWHSGFHGGK